MPQNFASEESDAEGVDDSSRHPEADGAEASGENPAGEVSESAADEDHPSAEREKRERLERALRQYRATLRNEAESDAGGFSAEHYRSQKPPHW